MNSLEKTQILERMKADARIEEDFRKQQNRQALRLQLEEKKNLVKEYERELRKAQTDVITISEQGVVEVQTQDLRININPRVVTNFFFPEITIFRRLKNPTQEIYMFSADYSEQIHFVFLEPQKCGSGTYLMRRLAKIGCQIFAPTQALRKSYATQLMSLLILQRKNDFAVPDRREWYLDESGKIKFFNGQWTWEELAECLR